MHSHIYDIHWEIINNSLLNTQLNWNVPNWKDGILLESSFRNITNAYQLHIQLNYSIYTINIITSNISGSFNFSKFYCFLFLTSHSILFSMSIFFIHCQRCRHFANCPCAHLHCSKKTLCYICTNFYFSDTTWHPRTRLSRWTEGRWSRTKWSSCRTRGWTAWSTRGRVGCTRTRRGSMKTRHPGGNWCTRYSKALNKLGRSNGSWSTLPSTRQKRRKFL